LTYLEIVSIFVASLGARNKQGYFCVYTNRCGKSMCVEPETAT